MPVLERVNRTRLLVGFVPALYLVRAIWASESCNLIHADCKDSLIVTARLKLVLVARLQPKLKEFGDGRQGLGVLRVSLLEADSALKGFDKLAFLAESCNCFGVELCVIVHGDDLLDPLRQVKLIVQELLVGEKAFRVAINLVFVLVLSLSQLFLELGIWLGLLVGLDLRFKFGAFIVTFLFDPVHQSHVAYRSSNDRPILLDCAISKGDQVLERFQRVSSRRETIVVIEIVKHVLLVLLDVPELLESHAVVAVQVV